MAKQTMYNRRGWWPSGWSTERIKGRWVVMNKDTGKVLYRATGEVNAISWADCNAPR